MSTFKWHLLFECQYLPPERDEQQRKLDARASEGCEREGCKNKEGMAKAESEIRMPIIIISTL